MRDDLVVLGSEDQAFRSQQVIKRFDSRMITGQQQAPLDRVVKGQRKHAVETVERCFPPQSKRMEHNFSISGRAKSYSTLLKFPLQLAEIVNFAVVDHDITSIARYHRLVSSLR